MQDPKSDLLPETAGVGDLRCSGWCDSGGSVRHIENAIVTEHEEGYHLSALDPYDTWVPWRRSTTLCKVG